MFLPSLLWVVFLGSAVPHPLHWSTPPTFFFSFDRPSLSPFTRACKPPWGYTCPTFTTTPSTFLNVVEFCPRLAWGYHLFHPRTFHTFGLFGQRNFYELPVVRTLFLEWFLRGFRIPLPSSEQHAFFPAFISPICFSPMSTLTLYGSFLFGYLTRNLRPPPYFPTPISSRRFCFFLFFFCLSRFGSLFSLTFQ